MKINSRAIDSVNLITRIARSYGAKVSTNIKTGLVTIQFAKDQVHFIGNEFADEVLCTTSQLAVHTHVSSDTVTVDLSYSY